MSLRSFSSDFILWSSRRICKLDHSYPQICVKKFKCEFTVNQNGPETMGHICGGI